MLRGQFTVLPGTTRNQSAQRSASPNPWARANSWKSARTLPRMRIGQFNVLPGTACKPLRHVNMTVACLLLPWRNLGAVARRSEKNICPPQSRGRRPRRQNKHQRQFGLLMEPVGRDCADKPGVSGCSAGQSDARVFAFRLAWYSVVFGGIRGYLLGRANFGTP